MKAFDAEQLEMRLENKHVGITGIQPGDPEHDSHYVVARVAAAGDYATTLVRAYEALDQLGVLEHSRFPDSSRFGGAILALEGLLPIFMDDGVPSGGLLLRDTRLDPHPELHGWRGK